MRELTVTEVPGGTWMVRAMDPDGMVLRVRWLSAEGDEEPEVMVTHPEGDIVQIEAPNP